MIYIIDFNRENGWTWLVDRWYTDEHHFLNFATCQDCPEGKFQFQREVSFWCGELEEHEFPSWCLGDMRKLSFSQRLVDQYNPNEEATGKWCLIDLNSTKPLHSLFPQEGISGCNPTSGYHGEFQAKGANVNPSNRKWPSSGAGGGFAYLFCQHQVGFIPAIGFDPWPGTKLALFCGVMQCDMMWQLTIDMYFLYLFLQLRKCFSRIWTLPVVQCRPDYLWGYFSHTLVYAVKFSDFFEEFLSSEALSIHIHIGLQGASKGAERTCCGLLGHPYGWILANYIC